MSGILPGTSDTEPLVSVVIPTHQRRASVDRALRALSRQALAPDEYEVIVDRLDRTKDRREGSVGIILVGAINAMKQQWKQVVRCL